MVREKLEGLSKVDDVDASHQNVAKIKALEGII